MSKNGKERVGISIGGCDFFGACACGGLSIVHCLQGVVNPTPPQSAQEEEEMSSDLFHSKKPKLLPASFSSVCNNVVGVSYEKNLYNVP